MFADFGAGFGPFLLGFLIPLIGYRNLYITMAILVVAATVLYYYLHGRNKGHGTSFQEESFVLNTDLKRKEAGTRLDPPRFVW